MISFLLCCKVSDNANQNLSKLFDSMQTTCCSVKNFEVLVFFDNNDKEINSVARTLDRPFVTKFVVGPHGRGYMDLHVKYNALLPFIDDRSIMAGAIADDFIFTQHAWDSKILELAKTYTDNVFVIHGRPHPPDLRPDLTSKKFNVDAITIEHIDNLTGIDEAPIWSRRLLELCGRWIPVSFTDAWTIAIEYNLWHKYKINRSLFLPSLLVNRTWNPITDGYGTYHCEVREKNFSWMKTNEYLGIVDRQVDNIKKYVDEYSGRY